MNKFTILFSQALSCDVEGNAVPLSLRQSNAFNVMATLPGYCVERTILFLRGDC